VFATAAPERWARAVADHLGIFDEVVASSHQHNLKGVRKAEALVERFGEGGFCYVGDSLADLAVWRRAGSAVLVGPAARLDSAGASLPPVETRFPDPQLASLVAALRALRPHQWSKNLLAFVPLLVSGNVEDMQGRRVQH